MADAQSGVLVWMHGEGEPIRFDLAWRWCVPAGGALELTRPAKFDGSGDPVRVTFGAGKWRAVSTQHGEATIAETWAGQSDVDAERLHDWMATNFGEAQNALEQLEPELRNLADLHGDADHDRALRLVSDALDVMYPNRLYRAHHPKKERSE